MRFTGTSLSFSRWWKDNQICSIYISVLTHTPWLRMGLELFSASVKWALFLLCLPVPYTSRCQYRPACTGGRKGGKLLGPLLLSRCACNCWLKLNSKPSDGVAVVLRLKASTEGGAVTALYSTSSARTRPGSVPHSTKVPWHRSIDTSRNKVHQ